MQGGVGQSVMSDQTSQLRMAQGRQLGGSCVMSVMFFTVFPLFPKSQVPTLFLFNHDILLFILSYLFLYLIFLKVTCSLGHTRQLGLFGQEYKRISI